METGLRVLNSVSLAAVWTAVGVAIAAYAFRLVRAWRGGTPAGTAAMREEAGKGGGDRLATVLLVAVALVGIGLRVWQFGAVPGGFNHDGAMAAVDGKALADHGTDRFGTFLPAHLTAWGFGQMSSLLSYLIAVFVKLFGLGPVTARLPQLLASLAGGVFFWLFMRDVFGKRAGLAAAAFVAIDPWHLLQSRWALDCNLLPHFFMGGLFFLNRGLSGRRPWLWVSMLFFGLCMYCYGITVYTIPPFLAAVCAYYIARKRLEARTALACAAIYLAVSWPFFLTMAINLFRWDTIRLPFVTMQYFPDSVRSNDILFFSEHPFRQLAANFSFLLDTTVLQKKDLPWNDIEGFGTVFLCSMPFVAAGVLELLRARTRGAKGLVVFALLAGAWVGLATNEVNVNRINLVYYGIMMFIVLGMRFVAEEIRFAGRATAVLYAVLAVLLAHAYFGSYAASIGNYFCQGFAEALADAEGSGAEKLYITSDAMGRGAWQSSEIMTLFHDRTDALYFQGKTNVSGGKERLPYKERYTYTSIVGPVVRQGLDEHAAFLVRDIEAGYFLESDYEVRKHGRFCSAVPPRP